MVDLGHDRHELLARLASLYYGKQMTQNAIADELGLSRVKVHRLLKEALEVGVVDIAINWPIERREDLEEKLKSRFGLTDAVVVSRGSASGISGLGRLGIVGARRVEEELSPGCVMAICLGATTHAVVDAMYSNALAGVRIVQGMGSVPLLHHEHDSSALVLKLADKLGGAATLLRSPPVADTVEDAKRFASQRDIHASLELARSADVALVGIGSVDPASSAMCQSGVVTEKELAEARVAGATGDIAWRLIDENGDLVDCELNHRVIGLSMDDLRSVPTMIAAVMGDEKVRPTISALNGGVVGILCTDAETSELILAQADE